MCVTLPALAPISLVTRVPDQTLGVQLADLVAVLVGDAGQGQPRDWGTWSHIGRLLAAEIGLGCAGAAATRAPNEELVSERAPSRHA
jgi:hypothetical protein